MVYTDGMSTYTSSNNRSRSGRRRGCGVTLLIVLVLLLVVGFFAYPRVTSFLNDYFAANGTWYGPTQVSTGPTHETMETYMDLTTIPNGSVTGSGEFCLPNLLGGGVTTAGFNVAGQRQSDGTYSLTISSGVSGPVGIHVLVGPNLQLQGSISNGSFHLTGGGGNTPTTLTMTHGTKTNYTSACHTISPLSIG
jgi:hypothetical protein